MHDAKGQSAVSAGQRRQVPVGLFRRLRAVRIDRDHARTLAAGFRDARPQMQVRRDRVGAPQDDQSRLGEVRDVGANLRTDHGVVAHAARGCAQHALGLRSAQLVEETPRHAEVVHQPERARIRVRHDALRVDCGDRFQLCRNDVERLVPADALEAALPRPLAADAAHRVQHAVGAVGALEVSRDLGAQHALRGRVIRIAPHLGRNAILHRDQHGAGVRAIVRAGAMDDAFGNRVGSRDVGAHW